MSRAVRGASLAETPHTSAQYSVGVATLGCVLAFLGCLLRIPYIRDKIGAQAIFLSYKA